MTNTLMDVYAGRTHAAPLGALESPRPSLSVLSSRSASVFLFRAAPGFGAWPRSSSDSRRRLPVSNTVARPLGRRLGPSRLMRQPATLSSCHRPGRPGPCPLAARPTTPARSRSLVSLRARTHSHPFTRRRQYRCPTPCGSSDSLRSGSPGPSRTALSKPMAAARRAARGCA